MYRLVVSIFIFGESFLKIREPAVESDVVDSKKCEKKAPEGKKTTLFLWYDMDK
jgi:hypothetical protein